MSTLPDNVEGLTVDELAKGEDVGFAEALSSLLRRDRACVERNLQPLFYGEPPPLSKLNETH